MLPHCSRYYSSSSPFVPNSILSNLLGTTQLGLDLDRSQIDCSHRLGYRSEMPTAASSPPKPWPVIVKLTSYETRKLIFNNKRKLKGTRYVVTVNLTKRRAELLRKARTIDGITSICLLDVRLYHMRHKRSKVPQRW